MDLGDLFLVKYCVIFYLYSSRFQYLTKYSKIDSKPKKNILGKYLITKHSALPQFK